MLQPLEAPELIYGHEQEPSEQSPVFYRERAYAVKGPHSDAELEEQLETELSAIRRGLRDDTPQFVHLALFDHVFEESPASAPLATLTWKNWQGAAEVWVHGTRRSTLPSSPPPAPVAPAAQTEEPAPSGFDFSDALDDEDSQPIPLVSKQARASLAPGAGDQALEGSSGVGELEPAPPDSGPDWQSPNRSGEYLIPPVGEVADTPPSSQRVLASEELIGTLFERMHELHYLADIASGVAYVIEMIEEHIPCNAALVHLFDIDAREFVVARGLGPRSKELRLTRTTAAGSRMEEALRRQATLELDVASTGGAGTLWPPLGVDVARAVCAPVHQDGRFLGAIELGRVAGQPPFSQGQLSALEYVCDQLAEFIADRPLDLRRESLLPPSG